MPALKAYATMGPSYKGRSPYSCRLTTIPACSPLLRNVAVPEVHSCQYAALQYRVLQCSVVSVTRFGPLYYTHSCYAARRRYAVHASRARCPLTTTVAAALPPTLAVQWTPAAHLDPLVRLAPRLLALTLHTAHASHLGHVTHHLGGSRPVYASPHTLRCTPLLSLLAPTTRPL